MKIHELQDYEEYVANEFWQKMIDETTRNWNHKQIDDSNYHSNLSTCYSRMFMPEECKMHAALVSDWADPQLKAETRISVARVLVYEKKIEEALDYYQQAFRLNPKHYVAIEEAGWCCFELKRWKPSQDWFTKGTIVKVNYTNFWEGLGLSLARLEKYGEALTAFKKALELCGKDVDGRYHHLIGQCYANLNDFYRALEYYTKSLDTNPVCASALNDMAVLYFNQEGDMSNTIAYLKKAEAIAEKDKNDAILQLIYINLARIYGKIMEFELHELYKVKLMEKLGFGGMFGSDSEEEGL